jgi:uncharacterized protein YkwD
LIRFASLLGLTLAAAAAVAFAPQSSVAGADRAVAPAGGTSRFPQTPSTGPLTRTGGWQRRLEARIAARVNGVRGWYGLRPLRPSRELKAAARTHSWDMARQGYFEHDSANGVPFWRRIVRFYQSRGFARWQVGENLFWSSRRAAAVQIVRSWMRSPGHRANLLSRTWRELGIGALTVSRKGRASRGRTLTIVTLDLGVRAR